MPKSEAKKLSVFEMPLTELERRVDKVESLLIEAQSLLPGLRTMTEDDRDPSLDYEAVIPELVKAGWEGTLSSEYEGNRWVQDVMPVDSREQVRRQGMRNGNVLAIAPTATQASPGRSARGDFSTRWRVSQTSSE